VRIRGGEVDVRTDRPLGIGPGGSGSTERKLDLGPADEQARQDVGPALVACGHRNRLVHLRHRAITGALRRSEQPALGRDCPEAGAFRRVDAAELLLELIQRLHRLRVLAAHAEEPRPRGERIAGHDLAAIGARPLVGLVRIALRLVDAPELDQGDRQVAELHRRDVLVRAVGTADAHRAPQQGLGLQRLAGEAERHGPVVVERARMLGVLAAELDHARMHLLERRDRRAVLAAHTVRLGHIHQHTKFQRGGPIAELRQKRLRLLRADESVVGMVIVARDNAALGKALDPIECILRLIGQ
jgi:hypothetical protein